MRLDRAKYLRQNQTEAEKKLWEALRDKRFFNLKFRRQTVIGDYVVDFVCHEKKLVVEIDGGQHAREQEKVSPRTRFLESRGYRVVRFWNNEVLENLPGVLEALAQELNLPLT